MQEKVSAMVIDFAGDFIHIGETIEEKRHRLSAACAAWNFACLPEKQRKGMLDNFMIEYQKGNPDADSNDCRLVRKDLELLIEHKLKKYPEVLRHIVSCKLTEGAEIDHISVASTPITR